MKKCAVAGLLTVLLLPTSLEARDDPIVCTPPDSPANVAIFAVGSDASEIGQAYAAAIREFDGIAVTYKYIPDTDSTAQISLDDPSVFSVMVLSNEASFEALQATADFRQGSAFPNQTIVGVDSIEQVLAHEMYGNDVGQDGVVVRFGVDDSANFLSRTMKGYALGKYSGTVLDGGQPSFETLEGTINRDFPEFLESLDK